MAGRSQHHIPQSVLRGFARDPNETPNRVWHYLRGAPVAPKSTTEVAAQRDFYSKPALGTTTLDDVITKYEEDFFTPLLNRLRARAPGDAVPHDEAAEYLGHLIPRGDHMRRLFTETMGRFLSDAERLIGDPEKLGAHMGFDDMEPGGEALKQMRKMMEDPRFAPFIKLMQIPPQLIERLGFALLREFAAPMLNGASAKAAAEFAFMGIDVKGRVKDAHTNALTHVGAGHLMQRLEQYSFSIEAAEAEMVLPDCVAIGVNDEGGAAPFALMDRDEARIVIAPLTPHKLLVGRVTPGASLPSDDQLVEKLAACSHMFFVAASDNFRALRQRLGEVSEAEVSRIVSGAFDRPIELLPAGAPADPTKGRAFQLETPDGFSEEEIKKLGATVAELASDLHRVMPLDCLAGFTVATLGELQTCGRYLVDPGAFHGITDGELKLWSVIPRGVGEALVREASAADYALAYLTATTALVRVCAASELDRLSAAYFRRAASMHYRGMAAALPAYPAVNWVRSLVNESPLLEQIDAAAVDSLHTADAEIEIAKQAFRKTSDDAAFARAMVDGVARVACAASIVAGAGEGALEKFPRFREALQERGLLHWFARYARDLRMFWDEPRSVLDPEKWGIHSERLFLAWGIVSWYVEPGRVRFILPLPEIVDKITEGLRQAANGLNSSANSSTI